MANVVSAKASGLRAWAGLMLLGLVAACGGSDGPAAPGRLVVQVRHVGADPGQATLGLVLQGASERAVPWAGTTDLGELAAGALRLDVKGLPCHCRVDGANPLRATLAAGQTTSLEVQVRCHDNGSAPTASALLDEATGHAVTAGPDGRLRLSASMPPAPGLFGHRVALAAFDIDTTSLQDLAYFGEDEHFVRQTQHAALTGGATAVLVTGYQQCRGCLVRDELRLLTQGPGAFFAAPQVLWPAGSTDVTVAGMDLQAQGADAILVYDLASFADHSLVLARHAADGSERQRQVIANARAQMPASLVAADGGLLTAWIERDPAAGGRLLAQGFAADGQALGPPAVVAQDLPRQLALPRPALLACAGQITLAWWAQLPTVSGRTYAQLRAVRVAADGTPVSAVGKVTGQVDVTAETSVREVRLLCDADGVMAVYAPVATQVQVARLTPSLGPTAVYGWSLPLPLPDTAAPQAARVGDALFLAWATQGQAGLTATKLCVPRPLPPG